MKTFILLISLVVAGGSCGDSEERIQSSEAEQAVADRPIGDVLRDHSDRLMNLEGVVSVGVALCDDMPCIRIGVRSLSGSLRQEIPDSLEGHPVDVREIGIVRPRGEDL